MHVKITLVSVKSSTAITKPIKPTTAKCGMTSTKSNLHSFFNHNAHLVIG